jgi:rRNA maturation endonuclease Nob1
MTEVESLREQLERERAYFREVLTAVEWARMKDRFHAFDAIKDDACPACGGRVLIEETHNAVRLRRVVR